MSLTFQNCNYNYRQVNDIYKNNIDFCKRFLMRSTRKSNPITTVAAIALPSPMFTTSIRVVFC